MDKWIKKDLEYNWHPYTQMKDCQNLPPIFVERAKGIKLFDARGKFYYDTIASWWCNVHGHNHPYIKKAIKKQLDSLEHVLFAGFTHKPAIKLAEMLINIAPSGLSRVFFSDNGSTSVEVALKMSFHYWQNSGIPKKTKFVSLDIGYHGDTVGAMSVSGVDMYNKVFSPLFFKSYKVPTPYCYRCPLKKKKETCEVACVDRLEELFESKAGEICALILEPRVLGAGGMIVYPEEYFIRASQLCKKFKVHLICDEVATGFGRTGRMFVSGGNNIKPDFLCLSKGITSGYLAMGATLTTDKIYREFYDDYTKKRTFFHGHTYTANPLACAAAVASLELFKKEKTLEKLQGIIPLLHQGLEKFRDLPIVGDVRCLGMIGAIELVKDKKTKQAFDFKKRVGFKIYQAGLKQNIILRPLGNIIYLFPPLCINKDELKDILSRTYSVIEGMQTYAV